MSNLTKEEITKAVKVTTNSQLEITNKIVGEFLFNNINDEYESFAEIVCESLFHSGQDWTYIRDNGLIGKLVVGNQPPQLAFELHPTPIMPDGVTTCEVDIIAGIYDGINRTLHQIKSKIPNVKVRNFILSGNKLMFLVSE